MGAVTPGTLQGPRTAMGQELGGTLNHKDTHCMQTQPVTMAHMWTIQPSPPWRAGALHSPAHP